MSGETTNYLGIILAVAGLFFVVVISSICMSCVKCCRKKLSRKVKPVAADIDRSKSYGTTGRDKSRKPEDMVHKQSSTVKHKKLRETRSQDYATVEMGGRDNDIVAASGSMTDLQRTPPDPSLLRRISQFYSFESMPSVPSLGESARTSSGDAWMSPEDDHQIFYTLTKNKAGTYSMYE